MKMKKKEKKTSRKCLAWTRKEKRASEDNFAYFWLKLPYIGTVYYMTETIEEKL